MVKEYRVRKRKLKIGRVIFALTIMWLSILGFLSLFNRSEATSVSEISYKEHIVLRGETLWSIAKNEQKVNGYFENKSTEEVIYIIKRNNKLESDIISENQKLMIAEL